MEGKIIDDLASPILVRKIKDISFFTKDDMFRKDSPDIRFYIDHKIGFNTQVNLVNLTLRIQYSYLDSTDIVMAIEVENIFEVRNLDKFIPNAPPVTEENMNVPSEILITIVGLSVSHTRALLAKNTLGTVYETILLPILDSGALAKHIFKDKINDLPALV